ncbi:MAG TPA: hypothetical protein VGW35_06155 [Methylomirabilota bacterium]|jgi:hypothetical protein|nr:hypothetical protein [Methylomirabilota bacterium]
MAREHGSTPPAGRPATGDRYFLVVLVDIDPREEDAFNRWYDEDHVPAIVACPGLVSGKRGVAVSPGQSPRYIAFYEATSFEAFDSPEFTRVRGWGPFAEKIRNRTRLEFRMIGSHWARDEVGEVRAARSWQPVFEPESPAGR